MKSYFVALIDIYDETRYAQYLAGFDAVFEQYPGEVLSVEDNPGVLEGSWPAARTVLIEFPSDEDLLRWYRSQEYQELARHRREASVATIVTISGRD